MRVCFVGGLVNSSVVVSWIKIVGNGLQGINILSHGGHIRQKGSQEQSVFPQLVSTEEALQFPIYQFNPNLIGDFTISRATSTQPPSKSIPVRTSTYIHTYIYIHLLRPSIKTNVSPIRQGQTTRRHLSIESIPFNIYIYM